MAPEAEEETFKICNFFKQEYIKLKLTSKDMRESIHEMVDLIYQSGKIDNNNQKKLTNILIERELEFGSGTGGGFALPNFITDLVPEIVLALGISPGGIDFTSLTNRPVHVVCMALTPVRHSRYIIQISGCLSSFLHTKKNVDLLLKAKNTNKILELLNKSLYC